MARVYFSEYSPRPSPGFSMNPPPSSLPHTRPQRSHARGAPAAQAWVTADQERRNPGFPFPVCSAITPPKTNNRRVAGLRCGLLRWEEARLVSAIAAVILEATWAWGDQISVCLSLQQGLLGTQLPGNREIGPVGPREGFPQFREDSDTYRPGLDPRALSRHPNTPTLWLLPPSVLTAFGLPG